MTFLYEYTTSFRKGTFEKYVRWRFPKFYTHALAPLPPSPQSCRPLFVFFLIFYSAIIINRKNWKITIKLHFGNLSIFLKKSERTQILGPPSPCSFLFAFQWQPPPPPPLSLPNERTEWPHSILQRINKQIWVFKYCRSFPV